MYVDRDLPVPCVESSQPARAALPSHRDRHPRTFFCCCWMSLINSCRQLTVVDVRSSLKVALFLVVRATENQETSGAPNDGRRLPSGETKRLDRLFL